MCISSPVFHLNIKVTIEHKDNQQYGNISLKADFCIGDILLGNLMLNRTIKSPLLSGCLGKGSPSPGILFSMPGFKTSPHERVLYWPGNIVGICSVHPTSAYKNVTIE